ncbi:MAG: dTDP-4-dehydrorhamnose reductase [Methylococcales bacterium]|nr:dTDP-4-dehydrorhamnose reductase [Methylococcales bacterium]
MPNIKSILVTGANGQLGQSINSIAPEYPEYQFHFVTRNQLDLSDIENITTYFQKNNFDLIINCAAYTAVDKAEQEAELADAINHQAVKKLAEIAKEQSTVLIHISTDYVFDGTSYKPYVETNQVNPQSNYGASKLKGERALQIISPEGCIIRTSWVYSEFANNFVKTMIKLGQQRDQLSVIFDQIGSPTYAKDLAQAIMKIVANNGLIKHTKLPIYNFSNEGVCSWYDFAKAIFEMNNINCNVSPIETKDYPTPAKRPHYSLLNKAKIKLDYDLIIPYWKDSLKSCLKALQERK